MSKGARGVGNPAALNLRWWLLTRLRCFERDAWSCGRAGTVEAHHVRLLENGSAPHEVDRLKTLWRSWQIKARRQSATWEAEWLAFVSS